jgi:hypothetical protein
VLLEAAAATAAAVLLIRAALAGPPGLRPFAPAAWVYVPLLVIAIRRLPASRFGFTAAAWTTGWRLAAISLAAILVPSVLAVLVWQALRGGLVVPRPSAGMVVSHLVFAALPEELFFRGYVQERLRSRWAAWPSIALAAGLFAAAHLLVEPGWMRAAVFVPGLVLGWLRERSGGLLAPTLFHWLANLAAVLALSTRSP